MKTLELTTWERVQLASYITRPDARANYAHLLKVIKLLDILELSAAEKAEVGWTDEASFIICPQCKVSIQTSPDEASRWDNAEMTWELEFEDADYKLLSSAPSFKWAASAARLLAPMLKKLA